MRFVKSFKLIFPLYVCLFAGTAFGAPINNFSVLRDIEIENNGSAYANINPNRSIGKSIDIGHKLYLEKASGEGTARLINSKIAEQIFTEEVPVISTQGENEADNSRYDTNQDGSITPIDALRIMNHLKKSSGEFIEEYDVNGDGNIAPIDALLILNYLGRGGQDTVVQTQSSNSNIKYNDLPSTNIPTIRLISDADVSASAWFVMDFNTDLDIINYEGIGISLTNRDGSAFVFNAIYNAPNGQTAEIQIDVFTSEDLSSRCIIELSEDTTDLTYDSPQTVVGVPFENCIQLGTAGSANFSNVGAILVSLNPTQIAGAQIGVADFRTDSATLCNVEDCSLIDNDLEPSVEPSTSPSPSSSPSPSTTASPSSSPAESASPSASSSASASNSTSPSSSPSPSQPNNTDGCPDGVFSVDSFDFNQSGGIDNYTVANQDSIISANQIACVKGYLDAIQTNCEAQLERQAAGIAFTSTFGSVSQCVETRFLMLEKEGYLNAAEEKVNTILDTYNPNNGDFARARSAIGTMQPPCYAVFSTEGAQIVPSFEKDNAEQYINQYAQNDGFGSDGDIDGLCDGNIIIPNEMADRLYLPRDLIIGFSIPANAFQSDPTAVQEVRDLADLYSLKVVDKIYFDSQCQVRLPIEEPNDCPGVSFDATFVPSVPPSVAPSPSASPIPSQADLCKGKFGLDVEYDFSASGFSTKNWTEIRALGVDSFEGKCLNEIVDRGIAEADTPRLRDADGGVIYAFRRLQLDFLSQKLGNGPFDKRDWNTLPKKFTMYFTKDENGECVVTDPPTADEEECVKASVHGLASPISLIWDEKVNESDYKLVQFPLEPNCTECLYEWAASDSMPLLVYDPEQTGRITSASQLFGSWTFGGKSTAFLNGGSTKYASSWKHGYEALGTLDTNNDEIISGEELRHLSLWFDSNRNGISEDGEVKTLDELKVTSLFYKNPVLNPITSNLELNIGFERRVRDSLTSGRTVDWFVRKRASRNIIQGVSSLKEQLYGIDPEDFKRELEGESPNFLKGLWKWKAVTEAPKNKVFDGLFTFKKENGQLLGRSFHEVPFTNYSSHRIVSAVQSTAFNITKNNEDEFPYSFTIETSHGIIKSSFKYGESTMELYGKSTVIEDSGALRGREISYKWVAVPY